MTFVRRGATLARVTGELLFDQEIRLVVRERILYDRLPCIIDWYGYEVWKGKEKLYWYDSQPHPNDQSLQNTLYKNIYFSPIGQHDSKPIMVDDACYFIPCSSKSEATFIAEQLNSEACLNFIKSLIFFDAKRPVNIDILSRIDLKKLSEINRKLNEALKYLSYAQAPFSPQLALVF